MRLLTLTCVFVLSLVFYSASVRAANSYTLDFQSAKTYVGSLNNIRADIGQPLSNFATLEPRAIVYSLNPSTSNEGLVFALANLQEGGGLSPVQLVISPRDLYVAGFIYNDIFFRFRDTSYIDVPSVRRIVELTSDSSYTSLMRIANQNRTAMRINRNSLENSQLSLISFANSIGPATSIGLTRDVARAFLQFITVSSEAIRFREIQRNFRESFFTYQDYELSPQSIALTLNWAAISEQATQYATANDNIIGNGYQLRGIASTVGALALLLHCQSTSALAIEPSTFAIHQCTYGDSIKVGNNIFTKEVLVGAGII